MGMEKRSHALVMLASLPRVACCRVQPGALSGQLLGMLFGRGSGVCPDRCAGAGFLAGRGRPAGNRAGVHRAFEPVRVPYGCWSLPINRKNTSEKQPSTPSHGIIIEIQAQGAALWRVTLPHRVQKAARVNRQSTAQAQRRVYRARAAPPQKRMLMRRFFTRWRILRRAEGGTVLSI